jgi:hypothetical protein
MITLTVTIQERPSADGKSTGLSIGWTGDLTPGTRVERAHAKLTMSLLVKGTREFIQQVQKEHPDQVRYNERNNMNF